MRARNFLAALMGESINRHVAHASENLACGEALADLCVCDLRGMRDVADTVAPSG